MLGINARSRFDDGLAVAEPFPEHAAVALVSDFDVGHAAGWVLPYVFEDGADVVVGHFSYLARTPRPHPGLLDRGGGAW